MAVVLEVRGGPRALRSDGPPLDLWFPLLVKLISWVSIVCFYQSSSEGAVSVEPFGEAITGSWISPSFSLFVADRSGAEPLGHCRDVLFLSSLSGHFILDAKLAALCTPISAKLENDGKYFRDEAHSPVWQQVHHQGEHWHTPVVVQGQYFGVLLVCNVMEPIVLLQVNLHMALGVQAPDTHFFGRLFVILQEVLRCFEGDDANEFEAMMGGFGRCFVGTMVVATNSGSGDMVSTKMFEFTYGSTIVTKEQDLLESFCCRMLSLSDGDHVEEAVLLLFGFFHRMWTTTHLLLIPRFNSEDILRLSSVMVHSYLQLNSPPPQVHTPDRPSGEPPVGHQLVWSIEALEDCGCSIFESELSTDDRWLFGSIGNLRFLHILNQCTPSYSYFVQLGTSVSCSVLESHVMLCYEL